MPTETLATNTVSNGFGHREIHLVMKYLLTASRLYRLRDSQVKATRSNVVSRGRTPIGEAIVQSE
jgi:hypothetical protein